MSLRGRSPRNLSSALNIYKKARLGNQFRWALKEAGYPKAFVETWTYELITLVALKSAPPRAPGR